MKISAGRVAPPRRSAARRSHDWSWRRTRRRLAMLRRLARPYKGRTALAVASLLACDGRRRSRRRTSRSSRSTRDRRRRPAGARTGSSRVHRRGGRRRSPCRDVQTYFTGWVGERVLADLRNRLFHHLQRLSLGYYERNRTGVIVSRMTNDVEALDQLVTDGVTSLVQNTLTSSAPRSCSSCSTGGSRLATLPSSPLMAVATASSASVRTARTGACASASALVTATLAEDIAGMRVVQSFTREPANQREFRERQRRATARRTTRRSSSTACTSRSSTSSRRSRPRSCSATAASFLRGDVTIGTLLAFMLYLSNFFDPVQQLSQLYNTFLSAIAALDKIIDVLDEEPEVVDRPDAATLPRIEGRVTLRPRPLRLRRRAGGAARDRARRSGRDDGRARRAYRRRASRRSRSCSRASTTRAKAGSRSTATTCAT